MDVEIVDDLRIYRGADIPITSNIIVRQPTLNEIVDFGEKEYFNNVKMLTNVGADLKWQLWDYCQIDYTVIDDFELFVKFISQVLSEKKRLYNKLINNSDNPMDLNDIKGIDINDLKKNPIGLVLNIDLADFQPLIQTSKNGNDVYVLYNQKDNIVINKYIYKLIVKTIRKIHGFKRNDEKPANDQTKMDLIEDARDEAMAHKNDPYKSLLLPMVSTMSIICGQCGNDAVWNTKIGTLLYNVRRITKMEDTRALLRGAYSGFADLSKVNKERFNIFCDI